MDPGAGASTWAFGSHIWTENKGIFTRNASKGTIEIMVRVALLEDALSKLLTPDRDWKTIATNKGNDPQTV